MAAVAAARVAGVRNQSYSSQLPDLGGSDPWSSGGEDDVGEAGKGRMSVKEIVTVGKQGKWMKGLVRVQGQNLLQRLQENRLIPLVLKSYISADPAWWHCERFNSIKRALNF